MHTKPLIRIFSVFALGLALLGAVSIAQAAPVVDMGNNTYSVTVEGHNKFKQSMKRLETQAMEEATKFCAGLGKQVHVVSSKEHKALPLVGGFPSLTLVFKALEAGAPEFTGTQPVADDLYAVLIKLDDLRKKGILTEEEFQAEKKKALSRSN